MTMLLNPQDLYETPWESGDLYGPDIEMHGLLNSLIEQIQYTDERHPFLNLVRQIESGGGWGPKTTVYPYGNPDAVSDSGAKGVYQFKDKDSKPNKKGEIENAVKTARNRAKQLIASDKTPYPGLSSDILALLPSAYSNPKDWTDDQADLMFIFNLFAQEKKGKPGFVDDLLAKAFGGDREAMHSVYGLHHTSLSDEGTQERLDRFIPLK